MTLSALVYTVRKLNPVVQPAFYAACQKFMLVISKNGPPARRPSI